MFGGLNVWVFLNQRNKQRVYTVKRNIAIGAEDVVDYFNSNYVEGKIAFIF